MSKTYFCKLVSGFFLNLESNHCNIIYGRSRSIIIEKKWEFCLWLALISSFKNGAWPHITKGL